MCVIGGAELTAVVSGSRPIPLSPPLSSSPPITPISPLKPTPPLTPTPPPTSTTTSPWYAMLSYRTYLTPDTVCMYTRK